MSYTRSKSSMHNNRVCDVHDVGVDPRIWDAEVDCVVVVVTRVEMDLSSGSADVGDLWSGDGGVYELVHKLKRSCCFDELQCLRSEGLELASGL